MKKLSHTLLPVLLILSLLVTSLPVYVLATESSDPMVVVNDPYDKDYDPELKENNKPNEYNIPFSTLYQFFERNDWSICVNL